MHFIWIADAEQQTQFTISLTNDRFSAKYLNALVARWPYQFHVDDANNYDLQSVCNDNLSNHHKNAFGTLFIWISFTKSYRRLQKYGASYCYLLNILCYFILSTITCNSKLKRKNSVKLEAPSTHFMFPSCNDLPVSRSMAKSLWACDIKYHIKANSVQDPNSMIRYTKSTNRHRACIFKCSVAIKIFSQFEQVKNKIQHSR